MSEFLHNESLLVQQMQEGNEVAFTSLYKHYSPRLYVNLLGMIHDQETAEEMVQELFTRIWQKRQSIGIAENFTGYMYRIAKNLAHDHFRRLKHDRKLFEKFMEAADQNYLHIEEAVSFHESRKLLNAALEHLSPQQKKVYQFVKEEGYTYKQAAEKMGISPQTVKEYLATTTRSIKKYILSRSADGALSLVLIIAEQLHNK
ncbi:RNA polymerase sigma factor [Pinibacter soli]|uniref:Sigma-70 family RNA polymerase sigma factor n=1 Tax=Pinibacter soli TaxID=3044211 RepID=A0ABT6R6F2_9BACT|nr:sigma-70 family RNA polymerase sigma factor [Pinibacter soli]MDI3318139.1 sigma-70 family RNA polymerase sigma factor [Pinibacter soli]